MPFGKVLTITSTALTLALATAPAVTFGTGAAHAQQSADYSAEQLDSFTVALLQVIDVREKYRPILQSAETEEEQQQIVEKANAEMMSAIEQTDGLTVDDYQEISTAATEDRELNDRIMKRVEAQTGGETQ